MKWTDLKRCYMLTILLDISRRKQKKSTPYSKWKIIRSDARLWNKYVMVLSSYTQEQYETLTNHDKEIIFYMDCEVKFSNITISMPFGAKSNMFRSIKNKL